eukprot:snap_masked-scaffold_3-processed-gene-13.20-mRNA-1 protein AED:1.00 eAED:1.00 QI:0/-1/0/0/-1/1/1/0/411
MLRKKKSKNWSGASTTPKDWLHSNNTKSSLLFSKFLNEHGKVINLYKDSTFIITGGTSKLVTEVIYYLTCLVSTGKGYIVLGCRDLKAGMRLKQKVLSDILNQPVVPDQHFILAEKVRENEQMIELFSGKGGRANMSSPFGVSYKDPNILRNRIIVLHLDLASLRSVKSFVSHYRDRARLRNLPKLRCLLLGASTFNNKGLTTESNYELSFGVNHLAHFQLTKLLLPDMEYEADLLPEEEVRARVILFSTSLCFRRGLVSRKEFENQEFILDKFVHCDNQKPSKLNALRQRASSMLFNILFSRYVNDNYRRKGIISTCFCPKRGAVSNAKDTSIIVLGKTPYLPFSKATKTEVDLNTCALIEKMFGEEIQISGKLFVGSVEHDLPRTINTNTEKELQEMVWELSSSLCQFG